MRYTLLLVPLCTLSALASPVNLAKAAKTATRARMTVVTSDDLYTPPATNILDRAVSDLQDTSDHAAKETITPSTAEQVLEKRDGPGKVKVKDDKRKVKWTSADGHSCKVKCHLKGEGWNCKVSGGQTCEEEAYAPFQFGGSLEKRGGPGQIVDYSNRKKTAKWVSDDGQNCKAKCHKKGVRWHCQVKGGQTCQTEWQESGGDEQ